MGMHSASTVLDDIIDELRLKYDSSVGILDGDAVRTVPNLNTLHNLGKLLEKLSASLTATEETDRSLLTEVDEKLKEAELKAQQAEQEKDDELEEIKESEEAAEVENVVESEAESAVKRERSDSEEDEEDDSVPLAKRRRHMAEDAVNDKQMKEESDLKSDPKSDLKSDLRSDLKNDSKSDLKRDLLDDEEVEQDEEHKNDKERKDSKEEEVEELEQDDISEKTAGSRVHEPEVSKSETEESQRPDSIQDQDANGEIEPSSERLNSKDDPKPPVQTGSYTQENDTRLKNPKSEFVSAQTLSETAITELGLFSEENNGLETQGKEYLKKKYGVASYPENDLKRMLPGVIPDHDFSKTKVPSNQVQFSTYQSYIESFFRPFANEDIAFVNEDFVIPPGLEKNYDPLVSPYLIPKLGPFYTEAWAEEDTALGSKLSSPSFQRPPLEAYKPKGDTEDLVDEKLLTEDVSCGPLSSRLLSAILSVHEVKGTDAENEDGENASDTMKSENSFLGEDLFGGDSASQLNMAVSSEDTDFLSMEERLKRELKYIGIFTNTPDGDEGKNKKGSIIDSDDWIINREDDEICAEIRSLQKELKGAVTRNRKRKKALVSVLEEQLAYQEFSTILEDLDKSVDQAYTKRLKAKSKRKKIAPENANLAQQQTASSGLKTLLDKRKRWISNIGKLFDAPEVMKRIPDSSVFAKEIHLEEEEGDGEVDVVNEEAS